MPVVHATSAETSLARITPVTAPSSKRRSWELSSRMAHASSYKFYHCRRKREWEEELSAVLVLEIIVYHKEANTSTGCHPLKYWLAVPWTIFIAATLLNFSDILSEANARLWKRDSYFISPSLFLWFLTTAQQLSVSLKGVKDSIWDVMCFLPWWKKSLVLWWLCWGNSMVRKRLENLPKCREI